MAGGHPATGPIGRATTRFDRVHRPGHRSPARFPANAHQASVGQRLPDRCPSTSAFGRDRRADDSRSRSPTRRDAPRRLASRDECSLGERMTETPPLRGARRSASRSREPRPSREGKRPRRAGTRVTRRADTRHATTAPHATTTSRHTTSGRATPTTTHHAARNVAIGPGLTRRGPATHSDNAQTASATSTTGTSRR